LVAHQAAFLSIRIDVGQTPWVAWNFFSASERLAAQM
jgi:hypothetical protein